MTTHVQLRTGTTQDRPWILRGATAATGPVFVILVLVGNSLTESVVKGDDTLVDLAAQATSPVVRAGLTLELLAFMAFSVFAAYLLDLLRRRAAFNTAGTVAVLAAVLVLAVKLGSAAPYLVALSQHGSLTSQDAAVLVQINGAAFVLMWLPFALFVGAAAVALHGAAVLGRFGEVTGMLLAGLGAAATLVGVTDPETAVPVPFLLSLVWMLVVGVKLAWGERVRRTPGSASVGKKSGTW